MYAKLIQNKVTFFVILLFLTCKGLFSVNDSLVTSEMELKIMELMKKGKIPGLSLVVVKGNNTSILNFGYADVDRKVKVSSRTLFEIGSCSKAFTALAALYLEKKGMLDLDQPVSKYLPWFYAVKDGKEYEITVRQLLHHTSGIPFKSISNITIDSTANALERTVRSIAGIQLNNLPGKVYEYATINYDVVGLIIQEISGTPYETFIKKNIFDQLNLNNTSIGEPLEKDLLAKGYKISFTAAREYKTPVFKGNYAAGYTISNAEDMAKWLRIQMGLINSVHDSLIPKSHLPDLSVNPFSEGYLNPENKLSYAFGWMINNYGEKEIIHGGYNPNYTASIEFFPGNKVGVVVLANSNSIFTPIISKFVINKLSGNNELVLNDPSDKIDVLCSFLCVIISIFILGVLCCIFFRTRTMFFSGYVREKFTIKKLRKNVLIVLLTLPYFYGIYLIPEALIGFSWASIFIWTPASFELFIYLLVVVICISYLFYLFSSIFPVKNKYKDSIPIILFLSVLSGIANTAVLFIITSSLQSDMSMWYLLYYFGLAYGLYVIGIKVSQTKLIKVTNEITFDIRVFLINKIAITRFQNFAKLPDGKILTTLSGDTNSLAGSANLIIGFISGFITVFSAFLYMATISVLSTSILLLVVSLLAGYYYFISKKARFHLESSRTTANAYMGMLNDLIRGFKELSIHYLKKKEFMSELIQISSKFKINNVKASIKFLNSGIMGNSFIFIVLGCISIIMPRIAIHNSTFTLISFVMVVLYIIAPINSLLAIIPELTTVRVSWKRISDFLKQLEGIEDEKKSFWDVVNYIGSKEKKNIPQPLFNLRKVKSIEAKNLVFEYKSTEEASKNESFKLGPLNFRISEGEIVFIVGGNGSGKSTLLNLLTGLYGPTSGCFKINDEEINGMNLGEYFSVIFGGDHVFQKLYGYNLEGKVDQIEFLIKKLKLTGKVNIEGNYFSTIELSQGQKKRLALLKCFLEDRQIYLFDEFAADQDPEFRNYFYTELLAEMKKEGKIIVAITHDEHYFNYADKIIKLDCGKIELISTSKSEVTT